MEIAAMGFNLGPREMTDVTCSDCGCQTQVPFKPDGSRPVYCQDSIKSTGLPDRQDDIRTI
ncbi:MAG: hypothetical protein LUQ22_04185 [Methanotrichaceae archaeon]|nr:hypothetical protein [Methanotrichaceae archaeon]